LLILLRELREFVAHKAIDGARGVGCRTGKKGGPGGLVTGLKGVATVYRLKRSFLN